MPIKNEEAIKTLNEILEKQIFIDSTPQNTTINAYEAIETVLNMLKEKDEKIESLEKTLDKRFIYVTGARTVYGRLMQLDKESIVQDDLKRRNELNQCIKAEEKYKELYHKALGDLAKADRENIKKDKQIDLMSEHLIGIIFFDKKNGEILFDNKEDVKQYFERKSEE